MSDLQDAFLSEEDLDLQNLSAEELVAYWNLWLLQAQITNDLDDALYSHGVFEHEPTASLRGQGTEMTRDRTYRAGSSIDDHCRACKTDRMHTVIASDADGRPVRVACDWCRSEHNYRGGPRVAAFGAPTAAVASPIARAAGEPFP